MEVIVIDDVSTDNSSRINKKPKRKDYFYVQQKNAGPAARRTKGIDAATANYIAFKRC
jgi:glycosyltransferase involved in cell wall biosynthesis